MAGGQRRLAERLRLPHRRACPRAEHDLRGADQERLGALPAGWQAPRVPEPDRWQRVGAPDEGPAAATLLRERAARCDGRRLARALRRVLRHNGRAGLRIGRLRGELGADCSRSALRRVGRSADLALIARSGAGQALVPPSAARPLRRLQLQKRAHLDAAEPTGRNLRGDLDRVVEVARLDEDEAPELLLRLDEGAIGGGHPARLLPYRRGGPDALKAGRGDVVAAPAQRLVVREGFGTHGLQLTLLQRIELPLVDIDQTQISHRVLLAVIERSCPCGSRPAPCEIDSDRPPASGRTESARSTTKRAVSTRPDHPAGSVRRRLTGARGRLVG